MKILFYRYNSICEPDILAAFRILGHEIIEEQTEMTDKSITSAQCVKLVSEKLMNDKFDAVFSMNFYPALAEVCNIFRIPYICWIVDCPVMELYSYSLAKPYNKVFIFDRQTYEELYNVNPQGIFYFPLGTNVEKNDEIIKSIDKKDIEKYSHDISFIGSLYREKCTYNNIADRLPDYVRGYLDGIIEAQYLIYGYNMVEEALDDKMVNEFNKYATAYSFPELSYHNHKAAIAQLVINSKVTELERYRLLGALSERYDVNVYTLSDTSEIPKVHNMGYAKSNCEMQKIFNLSKINLNMTSKAIRTGLSLRIWDVLGCGGFLITNYQQELMEYFQIGQDLETYGSKEELLDKVQYYLSHEDERKQIVLNGYEKVSKLHSYVKRIEEMLEIVQRH